MAELKRYIIDESSTSSLELSVYNEGIYISSCDFFGHSLVMLNEKQILLLIENLKEALVIYNNQ